MGKTLMDLRLKFQVFVWSDITNNYYIDRHTHTYTPEGECWDCKCSLCH